MANLSFLTCLEVARLDILARLARSARLGTSSEKKNGKISDIVQNSNYPLPPCPNNDERKNDKSQQSIGPSLLKEIVTN